MTGPDVSARMREDWNARAREDAGYYVAFGRRDQDDAEFFATATETVNNLETELRRVPAQRRTGWTALEIGCGPGRLMRPMSRHFAEIHGVDVSDEMIALAKEKLRDIPNAHPQVCDGARLTAFASDSIDFIYSYAVFQHIPSREVVLEYLSEVQRVLKPGGFARLQINGLPRTLDDRYTTWSGARFSASEILEFAQTRELQVLALQGASTQYMWTTWRKQSPGWHMEQANRTFDGLPSRIRGISNTSSTEPLAPSRGRFASIFVWVENLPPEANLHHLRVAIGDALGHVVYIGPPDSAGVQQVTVFLPDLEATGLLPVELRWLDMPLAPPATLRVIPPGPTVPRILSITDGINLVAGARIETRVVKMTVEQVNNPQWIEARIGGLPAVDLEYFCVDPRLQLFEVNFRLPDELPAGHHPLEVSFGRRRIAPIALEVAN